jgi:uncharacterized protein YndB with AHSA1/START domain
MVDDVEAVIEVAAPREQVWRAITEEPLVREWMGCLGFRASPGAIFWMQPDREKRAAGDPRGGIECRVQVVDAPRRLTFTWTFPDNPETWVEIRLTRISGGTHVKLVHSGWNQFEPEETERVREGLARGWHAVALPALRRVAEDSAR